MSNIIRAAIGSRVVINLLLFYLTEENVETGLSHWSRLMKVRKGEANEDKWKHVSARIISS